ncbi:MAG: DUF3536 domain-containing protein [Polyangiaceae bacterium]|nr:DUF3536 domain-containing protein [Polyangiaceae bacterium]
MTREPALIVHGHFYQPPRENPWTGSVDREPGAAPFHDWNERIHAECYRRNSFARVVDAHGRIARLVDNYRHMSWNFGPTLLGWLERHDPACYRRLQRADAESVRQRGGHGNGLAQAYNHCILPLCNDRDMRTQIRWGLADFKHRFDRDAEALWLPETACDGRTLAALVAEGLRFVVLAPEQALRVRRVGDTVWKDVADGSVDPRHPYLWRHPDGSGRSIAVFFYDGPISRAVAFEGVLASSSAFVDRFELARARAGQAVIVATDGESYGHHFKSGERCLAYALEKEAPRRGFRVTNFGEHCAHKSPSFEVELKPGPDGLGTSWSCAHGVGRWQRDCGCHTGGRPGWTQAWRGPLRQALDLLRDFAAAAFVDAASDLCHDPWAARDAYVSVLLDPVGGRAPFVAEHARRPLDEPTLARLFALLEAQRSSQLMYTSCGWFFSDIAGLESTQVLRYAGLLVDELEELGFAPPVARFLEVLGAAVSNVHKHGTGADIFRRAVQQSRVTNASVAAHVGLSRLATVGDGRRGDAAARSRGEVVTGVVAGRRVRLSDCRAEHLGTLKLATARVAVDHDARRTSNDYALAALYLGGIDVHCAVRPYPGPAAFARACERLWGRFEAASLPELLYAAEAEFGPEHFGLAHLLADERPGIVRALFGAWLVPYGEEYERVYDDNRRVIAMLEQAGLALPRELRIAAEFTLNRRLLSELEALKEPFDAARYEDALAIAEQADRLGVSLRDAAPRAHFEAILLGLVAAWALGDHERADGGRSVAVDRALELLALTERLRVEPDLERAQELVYDALARLRAGRPPAAEDDTSVPPPPSSSTGLVSATAAERLGAAAPLARALGLSETLLG